MKRIIFFSTIISARKEKKNRKLVIADFENIKVKLQELKDKHLDLIRLFFRECYSTSNHKKLLDLSKTIQHMENMLEEIKLNLEDHPDYALSKIDAFKKEAEATKEKMKLLEIEMKSME